MEVTYDDINALGEKYFDVSVYKYEEEEDEVYNAIPIEEFVCYGSVWDIASMMDSLWLLENAADEDWSEYEACISYLGHDLVGLTDLSNPGEYQIIADYEVFEQLAAE